MRIIELRAENIKRIKAVDIRPGKGAVVTVGGRNAQGKTSVLDAIAMAIGGEKLVPDKPVRSGAQKAFAEVDLGDYKVRRSFTAAGGTTLTVTAADGSDPASSAGIFADGYEAVDFDLDVTLGEEVPAHHPARDPDVDLRRDVAALEVLILGQAIVAGVGLEGFRQCGIVLQHPPQT